MSTPLTAPTVFTPSSRLEFPMLEGVSRPMAVIGPLGESLTLESLPPRGFNRWTPRRKAEVIAAVSGGLLRVDEARARYNLTPEEFAGWQRAVDLSGMPGLRITHAQHYKKLHEKVQKNAAA